jgi:TetR/AcrR family transcriptional regulator, tetracycline repressor protein
MDTVLPILRWLSTAAILAGVKTTGGAAADEAPRRSPGRPAVPADKIVAAALQIVDEEGADALSMRTLAQRLDSGTATLYRHFANRAEVIAQVVDLVFGAVEFDVQRLERMSWQQAIKAAAQVLFDALRRHRNVAPLLVEQLPIGPNAMAQRERFIELLLDNGFPPALAARSYATVARYVLGFAIQLTGHATAGELDDARLSAEFHGLDPDLFPATTTVADHLPVPLEVEFAFGLELIVSGLAQQLE